VLQASPSSKRCWTRIVNMLIKFAASFLAWQKRAEENLVYCKGKKKSAKLFPRIYVLIVCVITGVDVSTFESHFMEGA
jgi:hypothetical protein